MTEIPLKPIKTEIPPKPKKITKIPWNLKNDWNTPKTYKKKMIKTTPKPKKKWPIKTPETQIMTKMPLYM